MLPPSDEHSLQPTASFDGGDLDCGNGLLLLIRKNLDALDDGNLLEIKSTDVSVEEDLPAWCRLTKNELISWTKVGKQRSYLISKGLRDQTAVAKTPAKAETSDQPSRSRQIDAK